MLWLDEECIPRGQWPFLQTTYLSLKEIEESLVELVDLTEGEDAILITGCLEAYRQAVVRRVLDLVQAMIVSWNSRQIIGSVVCARALLETLATFHSLLNRVQAAADKADWKTIGKLVDGYAFSISPKLNKGNREQEAPPALGRMVREFIGRMEPGAEKFWDQICEYAHPNGEKMMSHAGTLRKSRYEANPAAQSEECIFPAIYNSLYSCCWLTSAMLDFDILLEQVRNGAPLGDGHPLIRERALIDGVVSTILVETRSHKKTVKCKIRKQK